MIWTLIIFSLITISLLIIYRQLTEKKKYQDTTYLSKLLEINSFLDTLQRFDDYVTWIQREKTKTKFSDIGKYFKANPVIIKKKKVLKSSMIFLKILIIT